MDCPVCENSAMIVLELDEVEVDYCIECNGIWLDAGELELLLGDSEKSQNLLLSFKLCTECDEQQSRCPICLKKMQKIVVSGDGEDVIIDSCPKGHGLWFERGELQDVLAKGNFDDENKLKKLLADIFENKEDKNGD